MNVHIRGSASNSICAAFRTRLGWGWGKPGRSVTSPRTAEEYAKLGKRTLLRDVSELVDMGLLAKDVAGYRARKEDILSFLPMRREQRRSGPPESSTPRRRRSDQAPSRE